MTNFSRPFSSKSVTEFWRRWHISLSTWFYDYLFNPLVLALRNYGKTSIIFGLLFTFFLSGFWHGAGWKFVIYGLLNGMALVYEYYTKKKRKKLFNKLPQWLNNGLSKVLTVGFITFSWIFFRAKSTGDAFQVVGNLFHGWKTQLSVSGFKAMITTIGGNDTLFGFYNLATGLILIVVMEYIQSATKDNPALDIVKNKPAFVRWGFYYLLIISILLIGAYDNQEFIYFQF